MTRRLGATLRGRIPTGLLGMAGLIVAIECAFQSHWLDWSGYLVLNCQFAGAMARTEAVRSPILCFGDSQIKTGIDPTIFERTLGRRGYNLAVVGSPPPLSYFLLHRALDAGARPEAILLGHMTMAGSPVQAHHFEAFVEPREFLDLVWQTGDTSYAATLLLTRLFPSFRHREAIRGQIVGQTHSERRACESCAGWLAKNGAFLIPPKDDYHGQIEPELADSLYGKPWIVTALYAKYFHRLVDLAASRAIPVYLLVSPIVPEAQAGRDAKGFDTLHTRNLRRSRPGIRTSA